MCGRPLPEAGPGGGRPRTKCEVCRPPRRSKRGERPTEPLAGQVVPLSVPSTAGAPPAEGLLLPESVYSATLNQLAAADRQHTAAGMAALALAKQLDAGVPTAPSVSNALLKALDVALAGAKRESDWLDELAERRDRRAAGA